MATYKEDLKNAVESFYLDSNYAKKHYNYNRVQVIAKPCIIKIYFYNKLLKTYDYQHSVSHYIESLKDLKRNKIMTKFKEHTYCFDEYEIFVNIDEDENIIDLYTWKDDLKEDKEVTIRDNNPLNKFEWKKGKNSLFVHAVKPKETFEKLSNFFIKIED